MTLASTMVTQSDLGVFLEMLVNACVDLFRIDSAGLMLVDSAGRLQLVASSSDATRLVELAQLAADAGPCLDSYAADGPIAVPDIASRRSRWPVFADAAAAVGLHSCYATPMRLDGRTLGTINLFSSTRDALDVEDLRISRTGEIRGTCRAHFSSHSRTVTGAAWLLHSWDCVAAAGRYGSNAFGGLSTPPPLLVVSLRVGVR